MHRGKIIAKKGRHKVIECIKCGFKHLYPIPSKSDLEKFYRNKYFTLIKKGGRAPEIRRLLKCGKEALREKKWLQSTLYGDIDYIIKKNILSKGRKIICDIGCGKGDFITYMTRKGWEAIGIEPSAEIRFSQKLIIYNLSLEEFIIRYPEYKNKFDAVTLLNVLEHVSNPIETLRIVKLLLKPNRGILCIRVPNDFNKLQYLTENKLRIKEPWWIAIPDHINYFSFESIKRLLESLNFKIIYYQGDFPMEFFLLMGENYVKNPNIGGLCHKKRVNFELSLPDVERRRLYSTLASIGIGRDCLIFAKS
ncbi:MAG: class I SAM-dependent methyltransferase [Candidatus Omnitrophica bacterium]|nr:class I SAM-dependent methyltransferase [Candidatus Omnitrophota bacterium]